MHVILTGGTGTAGRFIADSLVKSGHEVTFLGRSAPETLQGNFVEWDLASAKVSLPAADALVHCAFDGASEANQELFLINNVDGTRRLFREAKLAGFAHVVYLSCQAVYTDNNCWEVVTETAPVQPDTLLGQVKLAGEEALEAICGGPFSGTVLRLAGVYGVPPGRTDHKWSEIFDCHRQGIPVFPHISTEVHGEDLAAAVGLVLETLDERGSPYEAYNVSDLLLDRHELLRLYAEATGSATPLPRRAEGPLAVLEPGKLKVLGWTPGGMYRLEEFVKSVASPQKLNS